MLLPGESDYVQINECCAYRHAGDLCALLRAFDFGGVGDPIVVSTCDFHRAEKIDMTAGNAGPSTLIYLFADKFMDRVVTASWLRKSTQVPCKDAHVQTDKLACLLLASSFWALREDGMIALALVKKKRWMFDRLHVEAIRLKQTDCSGLEGLLAGSVLLESQDVDDVICRAFAESLVDPWADVVQEAVKDAIVSGYVEERPAADVGVQADSEQSPRGLRPKCDEIRNLEDKCENLMSSWQRFRSREQDLYEQLLHRCGNALLSCREKYFA